MHIRHGLVSILSFALLFIGTEFCVGGKYTYNYNQPGRQGYQLTGSLTFDAPDNSNIFFEINQIVGLNGPEFVYNTSPGISNIAFQFQPYINTNYYPRTYSQDDLHITSYAAPKAHFTTDAQGRPNSWGFNFGNTRPYFADLQLANALPIQYPYPTHNYSFSWNGESYGSRPGTEYVLGGPPWTVIEPAQPQKHIIALTHGWSSPGEAGNNYLSNSLRSSIESRLVANGIDPADIVFLDPTWSEAFFLHNDYLRSLRGTQDAGIALSERINAAVADAADSAQPPTLHLIGHSLGTVVNGWAASRIDPANFSAIQVTILDSPRGISALSQSVLNSGFTGVKQAALESLAAPFFWEKIPQSSPSTPIYVDNYYGEESWRSFPDLLNGGPAFGQPVAGANPLTLQGGQPTAIGYRVPQAGHRAIYDEYYKDVVNGTDLYGNEAFTYAWTTPALYGTESGRPAIHWSPGDVSLLDNLRERINSSDSGVALQIREDLHSHFEQGEVREWYFSEVLPSYTDKSFLYAGVILAATESVLNAVFNLAFDYETLCVDGECPLAILNQSPIVDAWMLDAGRVQISNGQFTLIPQSPAALSAAMDMSAMASITFDYNLTGPSDAYFSLLIDGNVVYSSDPGSITGRVIIDTLEYSGNHRVTWRYDTDAAGSRLDITGLEASLIVIVPEPSTIVLIFASLVIAAYDERRRGTPK